MPSVSLLTPAENFNSTFYRHYDGRYVVRLPFHSEPSKLGDSTIGTIFGF